MKIIQAISDNSIILTEAAVIETLRRSGEVSLHPYLENSLLIYNETGRQALSLLYNNFIQVAVEADLPIIVCAPTWRASYERVKESAVSTNVNSDAVRFMKNLRNAQREWSRNIFIGGLVGCKNDCYKAEEALPAREAEEFHDWQVNQLAAAEPDLLMAVTLPALSEAVGIARVMSITDAQYIISFVINRDGELLDGNNLETAFNTIDDACSRPPLGYMINCSYPSFLNADRQPQSVLKRLLGFQANSSSSDHSELEKAESLLVNEISDWGRLMIELNKKFGVKILGGCCGTNSEHLKYIVQNINNS